MVESKESSILPFGEKIPTRLGTAIVLAYFDYKYKVMPLMKRLNRSTAKYLDGHEQILDQFWVSMVPVKFSDDYIGNRPAEDSCGSIKNE